MRVSGFSFGYTVARLSPPNMSQCVFYRKLHWPCGVRAKIDFGDPHLGLKFSNILYVQPWESYETFLSLNFMGRMSCL